ncbi:MAG: hypothetical protein J6A61_05550 [Clostridia bacterium]|nr:hypothetical protein [Clostridia bacterium]
MMKHLKILAVLLAVACLTACGTTNNNNSDPVPTPASGMEAGLENEPADTPEPPKEGSGIPSANTTQEPSKEGETYKTTGMYIGMADNNLMVIIEANPEDGKPEKSYQISSDIDLEAMGITEGSLIDLEYTVDENGIKRIQSVSVQH